MKGEGEEEDGVELVAVVEVVGRSLGEAALEEVA